MSTPNASQQLPPIDDEREFRNALSTFATGVTVVTAVDTSGNKVGMTANSFAAVSLQPPLVLWSIARHSPSAATFLSCEHFAINVLALHQRDLARHFSRANADKYAGIRVRTGTFGPPLIDDAVAQFECQLEHRYDGGDHVIIVGRVLRFSYRRAPTLIFCNGHYMVGSDLEPNADADAELSTAWSGLA